MANHDINMTLERYAQDYANDPEFVAEGLSIKVIEEMLKCLEQRNLSQSWLAQKTGVSRAHISRILNAPPNMTLLTIAKIAVALGFTPDVCLNAKSRLPTPLGVGSTDTSFFGVNVGYWRAADTSEITTKPVSVVTAMQKGTEQQEALFQTENYNAFKYLAGVDDSSQVTVMGHSSQEVTVGGPRI